MAAVRKRPTVQKGGGDGTVWVEIGLPKLTVPGRGFREAGGYFVELLERQM
jgi:hypothetical protein